MTIQILNDFHDDGVFRDQQGTIWVCQSEMVEGMARAWDEGCAAGWRDGAMANTAGLDEESLNPYRAKGEQK